MVHERSDPETTKKDDFQSAGEIAAEVVKAPAGEWVEPKGEDELHERVCAAAEEVSANIAELYRATGGDAETLTRWLRNVEPRARELAAFGQWLQRNHDEQKDLYKCPRCLDRGYVTGEQTPRGNSTMRFCACELGLIAEAGWWFEFLYPRDSKSGIRTLREARKGALARYCDRHGRDRSGIQHQVSKLVDEYEKRRKRSKLERMEDE